MSTVIKGVNNVHRVHPAFIVNKLCQLGPIHVGWTVVFRYEEYPWTDGGDGINVAYIVNMVCGLEHSHGAGLMEDVGNNVYVTCVGNGVCGLGHVRCALMTAWDTFRVD